MPLDPLAGRDAPARPLASGERAVLVGFGLLLAGGFLVEVFAAWEPVKASALLFAPAWALLTALHEAGHALAARLCGWRVTGVVVGFGRVLWRFQVRDVPVELRAVPISGYALPVPVRMRGLRAANALVYLAGPGVELLVVGLLVAVLGLDTMTTRSEAFGVVAAQTVAVAALLGAAINLFPHTGPDGSWSDGMGLLMSPFLTEGHFEHRMAAGVLLEAAARAETGDAEGALALLEPELERYPRAVMLHVLAADQLVATGRRIEALLLLQAKLRDDGLGAGEREQLQRALDAIRARA